MSHFCYLCKKTDNIILHHICYDPEWLIPVCDYCHSKIHNTDEYIYLKNAKQSRKDLKNNKVHTIYFSKNNHNFLKDIPGENVSRKVKYLIKSYKEQRK